MFVTTPLLRPLVDHLVEPVRRWPVESQLQARRNAMLASTALAQRRAELNDIEEYLTSLGGTRASEAAARAAHG